jgi:hypothetical protein
MDVGLLEKGGFSGEGGLIDSKGWLRGVAAYWFRQDGSTSSGICYKNRLRR